MKKLLYLTILLNCISVFVFGQDNKLQLSVGYSHAIISNFTGDTYKRSSTIFDNNFSDTVGSKKHNQLNGFDISGAYRLSDHFAAKASFGWYTGSSATVAPGGSFGRGSVSQPTFILLIPDLSDHTKQTYLSVLVGVEYKDFKSAHKLNPFGHLMVGAGFENASSDLSNTTHAIIYNSQKLKVNSMAFTIDAGAGLDLKLNRNFELRIIQVDFLPAFPGKNNIQKQGDLRGPFSGTPFPTEQFYVEQNVSTWNKFQANFRFGTGVVFTPNL